MSELCKSECTSCETSRAAEVLHEALSEGRVQHPSGEYRRVTAQINAENSRALHHYVLSSKPQLVVEIGMAYAVSTLSILDALQRNGSGRLISIDPYIGWPDGRLVALHQVERAGVGGLHEHMHECSHTALPRLIVEGVRPDLVYIDGNHGFEYAFTDFFFADKLLRCGGTIAFNDAGWRSVFKVIRFVQKYRRYRELDVGLPRVYEGRNALFSVIARVQGRSRRDRYFEKVEDWEPENGFYRAF